MGFPATKCKKAIEASKDPPVLNDLIDAIIKDLSTDPMPLMDEPKAETVKYKPYSCEVCTFFNSNNPGPQC